MKHSEKWEDIYYTEMDSLQVPEKLRGDIMTKKGFTQRKRSRTVKTAAKVLGSVCMGLMLCDGIVYAQTGESIIRTIVIKVNGEDRNAELSSRMDENGNLEYYTSIKDPQSNADIELVSDDPNSLPEVEVKAYGQQEDASDQASMSFEVKQEFSDTDS